MARAGTGRGSPGAGCARLGRKQLKKRRKRKKIDKREEIDWKWGSPCKEIMLLAK
jgi:hypothetical protein